MAKDFIPIIDEHIAPKLKGKELNSFKDLAEEVDGSIVNGEKLHTAIRYGLTQAILDAVAKAKRVTMAEVIKEEYDTKVEFERIPIFTQSGDDRYNNVDKMIIKGAEVLPHGLINNVEAKLGRNGEHLKDYVIWLRDRINQLNTDESKSVVMHIDVYGTIGIAFDNDMDKMAKYLGELEEAASPYMLRIEGPMDVENREGQVKELKELRDRLKENGTKVELVADEWCNTFEDIKLFPRS